MNKILDLKKIKEAKVNKEAFPFFSVSNVFLNNKITKDLTKDFPEILKGGSFPSESLTAGPSFKKLIEELESKELKKLLESKLNINLSNSSVITTVRGVSRKRDGKIHSDSKTKLVTVLIYLNEGSMATSGDYRNFIIHDSVSYSHVINPKTGYPTTNNVVSATVISKNCIDADALATLLNVMDVNSSLELINRLDSVECFIIQRDGNEFNYYYSENMKKYIN